MATADGGAAPAIAGVEIVRAEASAPWVIIHVPLDAQVVDGFKAEARDDGRKVARHGEKGDAAQVESRVEDIAAIGNERAAEVGVDEELLRNLPTGPFARRGGADVEVGSRLESQSRLLGACGRR